MICPVCFHGNVEKFEGNDCEPIKAIIDVECDNCYFVWNSESFINLTHRRRSDRSCSANMLRLNSVDIFFRRHKEYKSTPIHIAAANCNIDELHLLLSNGQYTVYDSDSDGNTPLMVAANVECIQAVELLLDYHADANATDVSGSTPIFFPCDPEVIRLLVQRSADCSIRNLNGVSPLHIAAMKGCVEKVNILLSHNVEINSVDVLGLTPLHYATANRQLDCIDLLVARQANIEAIDNAGNTPMFWAVDGGDVAIRRLAYHSANVNAKNADQESPLHYATRIVSIESVKALIEVGADVSAVDGYGNTPLHTAAYYNYANEAVHLLISNGADINMVNFDNERPIDIASRLHNESIVEQLTDLY